MHAELGGESKLIQEFLLDHQLLTRGLAALREAVSRNEIGTAKELAEQLDRSAGAHMEFEEQVLYPQVAQVFGNSYVERLFAEHRGGREAVARIKALSGSQPLPPDEQSGLLSELDTIGDHVLSCGTLASHLNSLEPATQQQMLERLVGFRQAGHRWTGLASPSTMGATNPTHLPANCDPR